MYREEASKLLDRLHCFNTYVGTHSYIRNFESQAIVKSIANECKSTIFVEEGNRMRAIRYGSSFTKEAIDRLVDILLDNGTTVPRQTMNRILFENGAFEGVDSDVILYKNRDAETGKFGAIFETIYIDARDFKAEGVRENLEEIYRKYARKIIIDYSKTTEEYLPKISKFRLLWERLRHNTYTTEQFEQEYKEVLRKYSGISNENTLVQSTKYIIRQIMSPRFIKKILEAIKDGTAITPLGQKREGFLYLQNQIAAEIFEQMDRIPNLNNTFKDINQIYKDIETQLTAYSIDFRNKEPEQIEAEIKRINEKSLTDSLSQNIGENGYRNIAVGIKGTNIKLMPTKRVPLAMKLFAYDVKSLMDSSKELSDIDFVKRATLLMYRFIRIHPFPDSNGRTSRAFLNALTLNRDILVSFTKEEKEKFLEVSNLVHKDLGDNYLEFLCDRGERVSKSEEESLGKLVDYVIAHSTLNIQGQPKDRNVRETNRDAFGYTFQK